MAGTVSLVFAALGDSLTRGFVPYDPFRPMGPGIPYTSYLDNIVVTELSRRGVVDVSVQFVNFGVNGDSTRGMLRRLESRVAPLDPDYVIVWGGINDLYGGFPPEDIMENLRALYVKTSEIGAKSIACTLTSVTGFNAAVPLIKALNGLIIGHCSENSIPFADLFGATSDDDGRLMEGFSSDGVHLTAAGNEKVAQAVYEDVVKGVLGNLVFPSI
jgi:lysophospholipase L1-like esterase